MHARLILHVVYNRTLVLSESTAILIKIEGRFHAFQRFSSSKLVLKAVESCFMALTYYGNDSIDVFICYIS
jgi:hypothetical protein